MAFNLTYQQKFSVLGNTALDDLDKMAAQVYSAAASLKQRISPLVREKDPDPAIFVPKVAALTAEYNELVDTTPKEILDRPKIHGLLLGYSGIKSMIELLQAKSKGVAKKQRPPDNQDGTADSDADVSDTDIDGGGTIEEEKKLPLIPIAIGVGALLLLLAGG